MTPLHHTIVSLVQFQHSSVTTYSLKTFKHGSPAPDQEKCQKSIKIGSHIHASPNIPIRKGLQANI